MVLFPLCSIKFNDNYDNYDNNYNDNSNDKLDEDIDNLAGRILYIKPLFVNEHNYMEHVHNLYYKFSRFGIITGIQLYEPYGYIVFQSPVYVFIAKNFHQNLYYDTVTLDLLKSTKENIIFTEYLSPPIDNELRNMISKSFRNGKLENFVSGWTKIIEGFGPIECKMDNDNTNYECKICFEARANALIKICMCKEINYCLKCLLTSVNGYDSRCPFCREYFDPFDIRLIN